MGILPQTMQPRYMNVMSIRTLCDGVRANAENYAPAMLGSFFQRAVLLQNLCHAKQLLMTQGTESFVEYFTKVFALE
jgi:ERCC4-related helicase